MFRVTLPDNLFQLLELIFRDHLPGTPQGSYLRLHESGICRLLADRSHWATQWIQVCTSGGVNAPSVSAIRRVADSTTYRDKGVAFEMRTFSTG